MSDKLAQWTDDRGRVLLVKQLRADGTTGRDAGHPEWPLIRWPQSGRVVAPDWDPSPTCGGGLHAWPWGHTLGNGAAVRADRPYRVLAADPADVVAIETGKAKVAACDVVYDGSLAGAMGVVLPGMIAWVQDRDAQGDASTVATSGQWSTAATSGFGSMAATSGDYSTVATSGYKSAAVASGHRSTAAASGDHSTAAASGDQSTAAASGEHSTVATLGLRSAAAASNNWSTVTASGHRSIAMTSGDDSAVAVSGEQSIAAASSNWTTIAASGCRCIAAASGKNATLDVSPTSLGAVNAQAFLWRVRRGAVVAQRWWKEGKMHTALLDSEALDLADGKMVIVHCGEITARDEID